MLKTLLQKPRVASKDDKISFDHEVEEHLVFSNEPCVPATVKFGTKIKFSSPIVKIGGEILYNKPDTAIYCGGKIIFDDGSTVEVSKIRGDNWFEIR